MRCRFRHVCLTVTNLDRSIAFYCEHLGFVPGPEFKDAKGQRCGIFLYHNSGVFLELFPGKEATFNGHLCFEVTDIRAAVAELRAKGIAIADPSLGRSKALLTGFADPDGYKIELNEFSPPDSWIRTFLAAHDPANATVPEQAVS